MSRPRDLLFPERPREFRARRTIKIALRALHVGCAALLLGSHAFGAGPEVRSAWLAATAGSGILLLMLDLHASAAFLLQVRGAVLLSKLLLLAWVVADPGPSPWPLGVLLVVSVLSSHAPSSVRYRLLLQEGRITAPESRG